MKVLSAVIIAAGLIISALILSGGTGDQKLNEITKQQLADANGKAGKACWLAVDGTVYEIEQGYKWAEGQHTESSMAYCGADMSDVIDRAPHGRAKLSQLKKVGALAE